MSLQRYQGWHCDSLDQFSHHSQLKMATMQFSIVVKSSIGGSFLWRQKTHGTIVGIAFPSKVENWSPATKKKTKIIEFDQKLAELWVVLGPNLTLKNVFGGHLGSSDLECRSKVTNILMFFESSMPLPCLCKV